MAETKIEWADFTFNPWIGCTRVAPGCQFCYAEAYAKRYGKATWGPHGTRVKTSDTYWRQPIKWNREAERAGERRKVFCASLADVFEEWDGRIVNHNGEYLHCCCQCGERWSSPFDDNDPLKNPPCVREQCSGRGSDTWLTMADLRRDLFALIDATPHLDWLILSKRPENVRRMWPVADKRMDELEVMRACDSDHYTGHEAMELKRRALSGGLFRSNVYLGTSISDQPTADKYVPLLRKCRDLVPVLFLSCEPLLGPITIRAKDFEGKGRPLSEDINWVIVGGESGPKARPCEVRWVRDIVRQCSEAGVPCFVKQMGSNFCDTMRGDVSSRIHLRDRKGGDWSEWDWGLRVRQLPAVEVSA